MIVHPHFHRRRTGVTRHVEDMVRAQPEARALGAVVDRALPRTSLAEVLRRAASEDVVWHAHRNNELLAGLLLRALRRRLRVVFTRHTGAPPGAYTRWLSSFADGVVALSPAGARAFPAAHVVGHGVDVTRFTPPADRAAAWRALGMPRMRGIGVVGRIRPEKGQADFAQALAPLLGDAPDWQAVLVGKATRRHRPYAAALSALLGARLTRVPEQADVLPWYQALSILVHPSHSEGYSLVLLEAMATGCCVVATRLPYTDGLVRDRVNGFLYAPGDVEALRRILAELLADPARAEAVGRAAAADARARLGVEREATRLQELYASLSHRRGQLGGGMHAAR